MNLQSLFTSSASLLSGAFLFDLPIGDPRGLPMRVALTCLTDASFKAKTQRWFEEERKFLTEGLLAIKGFHPFRSQTNFLLVKIAKPGNAATGLRPLLINRKILVRGCDSFAGLGTGYFRVAVKRRRDNQRLLAALIEWTASSGG